MSEQRDMLREMLDRLFGELMADGMPGADEETVSSLWQRIEELGIFELFLAEDEGGFGGGWMDACVVFQLLGLHALPLPVGEALVARKLLSEVSLAPSPGPTTVAICDEARLESGGDGSLLFSGVVAEVPWGLVSQEVVVACQHEGQDRLVQLAIASGSTAGQRYNEADEPRDKLIFDKAAVVATAESAGSTDRIKLYGALLRAAQISGALEALLAQTVEYANQREQFGRPLSKFQALQHQLALLAEEAAAVKCAAEAAARSADLGDARFEMAAAKLRANKSVGEATSIAHQVHGAIGFTREHHLHYWTQRLWSWRHEFGNDRYWSNRLGRLVLAEGGGNFWERLTARGDS